VAFVWLIGSPELNNYLFFGWELVVVWVGDEDYDDWPLSFVYVFNCLFYLLSKL